MALTMYDLTIPTMLRGFDVLSHYLDTAATFTKEKQLAEADVIDKRLAPDMFSFGTQIQRASDKAKGGVARLIAGEAPRFEDNEKTFAELGARVTKTSAFLKSLDAKQFAGADTRVIELKFGVISTTFHGDRYLMDFLLPDFFFHITTAHDILRHLGVSIGKADYLKARNQ